MAELATMWLPASQMLKSAKKLAAWPELVSIAAAPPSSAQILAATASLVGFCRRV